MQGIVVRGARTFFLSIAVLAALPAAASAVTANGGLLQLPAPNDCVSSDPSSTCGTVVNGGLGQARSVAINPGGANAYVASQAGSLSTFGRNGETGALSFTSCIKDPSSTEACPTNSNRPLSQAAWVVANDDFVYVASRGGNAISEFSRDAGTGTLTPIGCIGQTATNPAGGPPCQTAPGLTGVDHIALSPDGNNLYAVSPSNSTLVAMTIDGGTGVLTSVGCMRGSASTDIACNPTPTPGLSGANSVEVAADGITVYVTASSGGPGTNSYLTSYTRAGNGALTQSQCFHSTGATGNPDAATGACAANPTPVFGLNGANGVRTSPDGKNTYVVSGMTAGGPTFGNSLVTFNRNTTTGAISTPRCWHDAAATVENCGPGTTTVGLRGAFDIALPPDGQFLYVSARTGNDVAEFARNPTTGDPTPLAGSDKCISEGGTECTGNNAAKGLGGASGITLSPNGLFAYVAAPADNAVAEFAVERPPVCANVGPIATPHNQPVTFTLPCTDPNPNDSITCTVDTQPANGTVTQSTPGSCTVTFTPNTGASGSDSFTYHATDTAGQLSNTATGAVSVAAAGTPSVTIADAAVDESGGTMTFQLTLSSAVGTPVVVNYATRDASAAAPGDYTAANTTATFPANQTTTTITVPIVDDDVHESTEHFFVDLTNSSVGTAIARPTAKGTIADDDASSISIGDASVSENAGNAEFTVTLSNPSQSTVTATYNTANGSAVAPGDFTSQSGKLVSFAPGEVSKQISVPIANDTTPEQTEQFAVNLSAPTGGASLGDATGTGTIQDEDNPSVNVSDAAVQEGNSGTRNAVFTVSLSAPISRTATVNFATSDGSAAAGSDYNSGTGVLTFAPGETSKTINVAVNGDTSPESDETFTLTLSGASQATIADGSGLGTILDDDTVVTQAGIAISDASVAEGDRGTRSASFTVSLSQAVGSQVTVDFATADGVAVAPGDYTGNNGTVTFAPGETSKTVTVDVNGDTTFEPDETFEVNLSNASGAPISRGTGTGTIVNDDPEKMKPGMRFSVTKRDRRAPFRYTVNGTLVLPTGVAKTDGCNGTVRIRYESGGNRIAEDFAAVRGNCTFKLSTVFENRRKIKNGRLVVRPRFLGNRFLLEKSPASKGARAG